MARAPPAGSTGSTAGRPPGSRGRRSARPAADRAPRTRTPRRHHCRRPIRQHPTPPASSRRRSLTGAPAHLYCQLHSTLLHLGLDHVRGLFAAGKLVEDKVLKVISATSHLDPTERASVDERLAGEGIERLGGRRGHPPPPPPRP